MRGNIQAFNEKYHEVRDIFEGMYGDRLDNGIKDIVCRVVAKYYDKLSDYDIRQVLNQVYDHIDSSLGLGEISKIVEGIVCKYVDSYEKYVNLSELDRLRMEKYQLDDLITEIMDRLEYCSDPEEKEFLMKELERFKWEKSRIEARIRQLEARKARRVRKARKARVKPKIRIVKSYESKPKMKAVMVAKVRSSSTVKPVRTRAVGSNVVREDKPKPFMKNRVDWLGVLGKIGVVGFLGLVEYWLFTGCRNVFGVFALTWIAVLKFSLIYKYLEK